MIEITNKQKSPVSVILRSKAAPKAFTTLTIPGVGRNKNVVLIEDEQHSIYLDRVEKETGFIKTRRVPNKLSKGE